MLLRVKHAVQTLKHVVQAITWYTIRTIPIRSRCSSSISISVTISIRIRHSVGLSVAFIKLFFKNAQQAGDSVIQTYVQDKLQSEKDKNEGHNGPLNNDTITSTHSRKLGFPS